MKKPNNKIMTEETPVYTVDPQSLTQDAPLLHALRKKAEDITKEIEHYLTQYRFNYDHDRALTSPPITELYLINKLSFEEHEKFLCIFLDNQHNVLRCETLFTWIIDGASVYLDGASVYPREVIKRALELNAAALIFAHNHPSGLCVPSQADKHITEKLKSAASLMDIRVLDHIIIAGINTYSFAEHGLI